MISVTTATKDAWKDETSYKEYQVDYGSVILGNSRIVQDSINISASILNSNMIENGGCIPRKLEITLDINIPATLTIGLKVRANNTEWIPLFYGSIDERDKRDNDSEVLTKYTVYDRLYGLSQANIAGWFYEVFAEDYPNATIGDAFFALLDRYNIPTNIVSLMNGSCPIYFDVADVEQNINGLDFLKQICQLEGGYGEIDGEGYFRIVKFNNSVRIPEPIPYFKNLDYTTSDFVNFVGSVVLKPTSESQGVEYIPPGEVASHALIIQDNFFIKNYTLLEIQFNSMAEIVYQGVEYLRASSFSAEQMALPWVECGDDVQYYDARTGTTHTFTMFSWTYKGTQACMNTFLSSVTEGLPANIHDREITLKRKERSVNYSDTDITEGVTRLATGNIFLVYE